MNRFAHCSRATAYGNQLLAAAAFRVITDAEGTITTIQAVENFDVLMRYFYKIKSVI